MNHPQDAPPDPHVPIPSHMNELQKSSVLWNNLKSYTERRPGVGSANRDTWQFVPNDDNDSGFAVAPADQQGWALRDILLPGYVHMNRTTTERLVDTEMQMAILVDRDIIHIVNSLLKTRYRNQSEAGAKWNERDPSVHPDLQNSRDAPFYPVWGGPVPKGHIYAGIQNNQQPEEQPEEGVHNPGNQLKKAGLPDGLLFFDMEEKSQVALYEVKVYWSYSFRFFTGMRHLTNGAHFNWERSSWIHNMMKQIWSELKFFNVKWGFWTNGKHIFVFVMTGDQKLVVSDWHDYQEPEVVDVIAGLSFAAIDHSANAPGNNGANLIDTLCPAGHLHNLDTAVRGRFRAW